MKEASAGRETFETNHEVSPAEDIQPRMAENVAGLFCYLLGWVSGLIFFLIDKRPFVRFHAAQSMVVFGGLNILTYLLGIAFGFSFMAAAPSGFSRGYELSRLVDLVVIVLWFVLMIKAYQEECFRLPIAANFADKLLGKP